MIARGSAVNANRLLTRLKPLFGWAVERGLLEASPAAALKPPTPETSRDRVLTNDELNAVWRAASGMGYPFGNGVQLLMLTGTRRAEVFDAAWSEFNLANRTWTIPRARSKTDIAHIVPLSGLAIEILNELPRVGTDSGLVFTTNDRSPFSGFSKAFDRLNVRAADYSQAGEPLPYWRLHDLRRTFATGCAVNGVPLHVVEKCLNHTSGTFGGIVSVYQRHEFMIERRRAMDVWAEHLASLVGLHQ
jgi:integrase